jgi:hypothetical protein
MQVLNALTSTNAAIMQVLNAPRRQGAALLSVQNLHDRGKVAGRVRSELA